MKIKIGTQLDDEVYKELKMTAAKEHRAVGELIQTAISDYLTAKKRTAGGRFGLKRFLASPSFKLTEQQFRETMESDFYDQ